MWLTLFDQSQEPVAHPYIKVKELFGRVIPELSDDIADEVYPGAKTAAEVREKLVEAVKSQQVHEYDMALNEAMVDALAAVCDTNIPAGLRNRLLL